MSRKCLVVRLFSTLALAVLGFLLIPAASALPLKNGGGGGMGFHHNFVNGNCTWPDGSGDWTTNSSARTVKQEVGVGTSTTFATCDFTDLDPDGNFKVDDPCEPDVSCPKPAGSATFSLSLTFKIPANTSGQRSGIVCTPSGTNAVRTYKAVCESGFFTNGGDVTGVFALHNPGTATAALTKMGCTNLPTCNFGLGSLPEVQKRGVISVDTSKNGCDKAFPGFSFTLGTETVSLAKDEMMVYNEGWTNSGGSCGVGTVAPISAVSAACHGDASDQAAPSVTGCNLVPDIKSKGDYHVGLFFNTSYLFNASSAFAEMIQNKVQDNSSCSNMGVVKANLHTIAQLDIRSIAYTASSPTLRVQGYPDGLPPLSVVLSDTNSDGINDTATITYSQCGLGGQLTAMGIGAGETATLQFDGDTINLPGSGGSVPWTATTTVGVN